MGTKELKFKWPEYDCVVDIDEIADTIRFVVRQHGADSAFQMERSQAHLLMLYLQERLGYGALGQ
jgi:hypothetical protein